ncbi:hypothetical protein AK830_g4274 [Neonectria ditissima]|uniref:Uncharacterized protein n=1 Tax=Neonectria ditissima TaxID=78410 RepID=A0A0P7BLS6_9HYPO|nr:hypothetical protein AK830_g4274 [Neonectria ditissima]
MFLNLQLRQSCNDCGKQYFKKHTCYGKGHRRKASNANDGNTRALSIEKFLVERVITSPSSSDLAKSLVAASTTRSLGLPRRIGILRLATDELLTQPSLPLGVEIVHHRSVLMRLNGDATGSQQTIQAFVSEVRGQKNDLSSSDLAVLHISQAHNHLFHFRHQDAHSAIRQWSPTDCRSESQDRLLWDQLLCVSRILRGEGKFDASRQVLQTCCATTGLAKPKRCIAVSSLADVYCELSYQEQDPSYLSSAEVLVLHELQSFRVTSGQCLQPRGLRRLLLSLFEIQINQGAEVAEALVLQLLDTYTMLNDVDVVDRLGHVRTLILYARMASEWEDAAKRWAQVLHWNAFYNPREEEVFTCGVAYLFLHASFHRLERPGESSTSLQQAINVLGKKQPQFLIPGLGTYIFSKAKHLAHMLD